MLWHHHRMTPMAGADQPPPAPNPVLARRRLSGELRRLRAESELRLADVAEAIGKSVGAVSRYESGEVAPLPSVLQSLLQTYGVTDDSSAATLMAQGDQARKPSPYAGYTNDVSAGLLGAFELTATASRIRGLSLGGALAATGSRLHPECAEVVGRSGSGPARCRPTSAAETPRRVGSGAAGGPALGSSLRYVSSCSGSR